MHISPDGFVAGPNGELNWAKIDEEIFDHAAKRSVRCPPQAGAGCANSVHYKLMPMNDQQKRK